MELLEGVVTGGVPAQDLAWEEALLQRGDPAWIAYGWDAPVLVLGRAQRLEAPWVREAEVPSLRRSSGGTAVLHHRDLSLALVLPASHPWCATIHGLYGRFLDVVAEALARHGVAVRRGEAPPAGRSRTEICFEDHALESLLLGGRKVLGASQTRRRGAVMVHGALLFHLDVALQARVYQVGAERVAAAMAPVEGIDRVVLARTAAAVAAAQLGATLREGAALACRP
ncbi:MAG: lipoate--protein ligase family protein [Deltaproteobacteria bacterium]|nr:lipoate--protein ligase family protein [Deltaproteobacteria bacterium]